MISCESPPDGMTYYEYALYKQHLREGKHDAARIMLLRVEERKWV
jgi:hypothetical protein